MGQSAKLISLATSVPPHVLNQRDVASAAQSGLRRPLSTISSAWRGCSKTPAIRQRHAVRPIDWYFEPLGWPERTKRLSRGRMPAVCRCGDQRARRRRLAAARRRYGRHDLIDRHRDAQPRSARRRAHGLSRRCRARSGLRPWLRRRRLRALDRLPPRAARVQAASCCWSQSKSARWPSVSTN